jgi:hypothetical protein
MRILKSPRWRRRLIKIGVLLAFIPAIYVGARLSTSGNPENANGPEVPDYAQPKRSPFTAAEKREVRPVLAQFIRYAVAREDPARAWDVAGPDIREGLTRRQWDTGNIPVVPYPASHKGLGSWSYVKYSYTNTVGLEVFVFPKPGSGYSAMTADAEVLKKPDGRWFVNYWLPERFHGPPALSAEQLKATRKAARADKKKSSASTRKTAVPQPVAQPPRARGVWWVVPIGLLSLIILAPLALLLVSWLRNRRAAREIFRST